MRTKEIPPIVIDPQVEPFMKGDMLEIRDLVLEQAVAVAKGHGLAIDRIFVNHYYCMECDCKQDACGDFTFDIELTTDDDKAFSYWEEVSGAITKAQKHLSKTASDLLNEIGVLVYW